MDILELFPVGDDSGLDVFAVALSAVSGVSVGVGVGVGWTPLPTSVPLQAPHNKI
ncbi:MAG: hypothetical protein NTX25_03190 [Proteobacteria bacterium]|nr:hypothetical protein [Pseudomonadota bacterium]